MTNFRKQTRKIILHYMNSLLLAHIRCTKYSRYFGHFIPFVDCGYYILMYNCTKDISNESVSELRVKIDAYRGLFYGKYE